MAQDTATVERIVRLEEHLKEQDRKLDLIIRLTEAQDGKIKGLTDQVSEMAPTVQQVADALTFAKVGKSVFRLFMAAGIIVAPVVYYLQDRWAIVWQLFKRIP